MSLDWNVSAVPNHKTRCFVPDTAPRREGKHRLADDTNALIWGAIALDLGSIKKKNVDEWLFRIDFCRSIDRRWIEQFEGDNVVGYYPSLDAIEDHIGLTTNVITLTRLQWVRKMARWLENRSTANCIVIKNEREKVLLRKNAINNKGETQ
jgi:hypothetical protein